MSTTIDEKVVEMRFDNRDFEKNVRTSMNTLSDLKNSLKFSDASKSFSNLEKAAKGVKFDGLSNAIETVKMKFSGLQIAAARILSNIVDDAYFYGKRLVKALSFDQISAGWSKYAEKTSSVQTIMAATAKDFEDTGVQMEYVNGQLEKLNWFTDETSYNFLDMVNNIGKFTSNNVKLDDAVTAMQGISNWAAISGANVGEASRAMYNLSQAMAMGEVKLMDWRSIENANMATYEFKQQVVEAAVALGTITKKGEDAYDVAGKTYTLLGLFSEGLKDGWFSSDVLMKTLSGYGEFTNKLYDATEEMGLTATEMLEAIDEFKDGSLDLDKYAKETGVSVSTLSKYINELGSDSYELGRKAFKAAQEAKTFQEAIDSVKDAVSTGWMTTFEHVFGDYQTAKKVWTGLANELYDVFAESGNTRNELLRLWALMGGRDQLFEGVKNVWTNIRNIIGSVKEGIRDIFPPMTVKSLIELTNKFRDFSERLMVSEENLDRIKRTFRGFAAVLDIARQFIVAIWGGVKQLIRVFTPFGGTLLETTATIGDFLVKLRDWIKENDIFVNVVNKVVDAIKYIANGVDTLFKKITGYGVVDIVKKIGDNLYYTYQKLSLIFKLLFGNNTLHDISDLIKQFKELTGMDFDDSKLYRFFKRTKQIFLGFKTLISDLVHGEKFGDAVKKFIGTSFGSGQGKALSSFGESFQKAWVKISESFESFKKGFSDFSAIIKKRWDSIKDSFSGARDVIVEAWEKIKEVIAEVSGTDINGMSTLGKVISVLLYPIQLFFTGLKYLFQGLGVIIEDFGPSILTFLKKIGNGIINFGRSIGDAIKNADFSKFIDLVTSGSLAIILGKLAKSLLGFSKVGDTLKSFGKGSDGKFSIFVFLKNLYDNGKKVTERIGDAFASMLDSIRGVLVAWQKDLQANVILKIALAIGVLAASLVILSGIDQKSLTSAIGAITMLFTELVAAFKIISGSMVVEETIGAGVGGTVKKMLTQYTQLAAFILSLSASILLMSIALKKIATLDKDQIKNGLIGFTVIFAELTAFLKYISTNVDSATIGIKGLISLSISLYIMASAVKKLAKLDTKSMFQGISGIGTILLLLVGFIKLLGNNLKSASMSNGDAQFQSLLSIANGILILSIAMKILVSSVKKLGKMDPRAMEQGLLGFAGILAIIDGFIFLFKSPGKEEVGIMRIASMMIVMSMAMVLMASSIKIIGTMDFEHVSNALIGFAGVMGILVLAFDNIAGNKNTIGAAGAMLMVANSMVTIALAMRIMGSMDFEHMASATLGFAGAIGIMVVAFDLLKGQALEILKISGALLIFSVAFTTLSVAMKIMSTIGVVDLAKTFVAVSGLFGVMSLFSAFTEGFNAIKAAASILVLTAALNALVPALLMFKIIDMGAVLKMVTALGAIVLIMGVAATTLSGAIVPLLAVSGSLALFGVGILAMGVGFTALAAGLTALGGSLPVLVEFLAIFSAALLSFIPKVILSFFDSVLKAILTFGKDILMALIAVGNAVIPPLIELVFNILDALFESLAAHLPNIVKNLVTLIIDMIDTLGTYMPKIMDSLVNLALDLIEGFGEAFKKNIRRAVEVVVGLLFDIVSGALDALFGGIGDIIFGRTEDVVKDVEDLLTEEQKSLVDHIRDMNNAYNEVSKNRDASIGGIQNEYKYIQDLADEYNSLVGSNGEIIDSYKDRADVILTTMANAMGIERDEIDKLIDKNGKLGESYNDVIKTMQAKAYLEANEESYKQAIKGRTEANDNYVKSVNEYTKSSRQLEQVNKDLAKAEAEYYDKVDRGEGWDQNLFDRIESLKKDKQTLELSLGTLRYSAEEASQLNSKYATEIYNYEGMLMAVQKGNVSAMKEFTEYYNTGLILAANGNKLVLDQQVTNAKSKLEELEYAYKNGLGNVTEAQVEAQRNLYSRALGEQSKFEAGYMDKSYNFGSDVVDETARGVLDNKGKLYNVSNQAATEIETPYLELPEELKSIIGEADYNMCIQHGYGMDDLQALSLEGGEGAVNNLVNGLKSGEPEVKAASSSLGNAAINPIKDKSKLMAGIANDYVDGFVNQAMSRESMSKVEKAAVSLAAHFMSIYAKTGDAHSPSRKMAEIGTWYVQGFINGANSLKSSVGETSEDIANTSIDTMSEILTNVSNIFGSDLDVDPTIRPVLDLSNVTEGVNTMNGMFGSRTLSLTGGISRDSQEALDAKLQNGIAVNNTDVVNEISRLREDVNTLNKNMGRWQVVMDTGALVGQISQPINSVLGRQAVRRGRGV